MLAVPSSKFHDHWLMELPAPLIVLKLVKEVTAPSHCAAAANETCGTGWIVIVSLSVAVQLLFDVAL